MQRRTKLLLGTIASSSLIIAASIYLSVVQHSQGTKLVSPAMTKISQGNNVIKKIETFNSPPQIQKSQKNAAKEFTDDEGKKFTSDVTRVFGTLVISSPNPEYLRRHLAKLNEQGKSAIDFISKELSHPASQDSEVKQRLYLIDYLNYRLRWDQAAMEQARQIVEEPIPANTPIRYRATTIVEKSEIIEGIARVNWKLAAELIIATNSDQIKRLASSASYYALVDGGKTKEEAKRMVKTINPNFRI